MMEKSIQHSRCHDLISHHLCPILKPFIGGDDDGFFFIQLTDEIEKQVWFFSVNRGVADLIYDQHIGSQDPVDPECARSLDLIGFQEFHRIIHAFKTQGVPGVQRFESNCDRQMSLSVMESFP